MIKIPYLKINWFLVNQLLDILSQRSRHLYVRIDLSDGAEELGGIIVRRSGYWYSRG